MQNQAEHLYIDNSKKLLHCSCFVSWKVYGKSERTTRKRVQTNHAYPCSQTNSHAYLRCIHAELRWAHNGRWLPYIATVHHTHPPHHALGHCLTAVSSSRSNQELRRMNSCSNPPVDRSKTCDGVPHTYSNQSGREGGQRLLNVARLPSECEFGTRYRNLSVYWSVYVK